MIPNLYPRSSMMQTRREMLGRSAAVAGLLAGLGLLPAAAQAAIEIKILLFKFFMLQSLCAMRSVQGV